jgi:hypothetical protein
LEKLKGVDRALIDACRGLHVSESTFNEGEELDLQLFRHINLGPRNVILFSDREPRQRSDSLLIPGQQTLEW